MRNSFPHSASPVWSRVRNVLLKASAVAALAFGGCKFSELEAPTWSPDLLAPAAHARLGIEDIQDFQQLSFRVEARTDDIGLPPGTYNGLPAMYFQTAGPFDFTLFSQLVDLDCEIINLSGEITNSLPVAIQGGTIISFRNSSDGSLILDYTIEEPIPAGQSVDFSTSVESMQVGAQIRFNFSNIQTVATQGETVVSPQSGLQADVAIGFEGVDRVRYKAGQRIEHADTIPIELGLGELEDVQPDGVFTVKLENFFPVEGGFQLYFLPKSRNYVLDSLFIGQNEFEGAGTTPDGIVDEAVTTYLEVPIDKERLLAIRPAKYVAIRTTVRSLDAPEILTADHTNYIDLRIIADLNVTVE